MTTPFHGMRCTHCQMALAEPDSCLYPSCTLKAQLRVRAEATASDPAQAQLGGI